MVIESKDIRSRAQTKFTDLTSGNNSDSATTVSAAADFKQSIAMSEMVVEAGKQRMQSTTDVTKAALR